MTPEELLKRATSFDGGNPPELNGWLVEEDDDVDSWQRISVEQRRSEEHGVRWAVASGSRVLNVNGEFQYEPYPSERSEEFLQGTRFNTIDEAFARLNAWKDKVRSELRASGAKTLQQM